MLARTCDTERDWASMSFNMRWSSQRATCPSARIREIAPLGRGKLLWNADLCLDTRNLQQIEPTSEYLEYLLKFWELESFGLDTCQPQELEFCRADSGISA